MMVVAPELYAYVTVNNEKLKKFLEELRPDCEAGKLSYDDVKQKVIDNLYELCDIKIGQ